MDSAPQVTITTPVAVHNQHAAAIAQNLKGLGHNVEVSNIVGVTEQTPIEKTKELSDLGADISGEDLTHLIGTTIGLEQSTTRTTKSANPLKMLMSKLMKKKGVEEEIVEK